MSRVRRPVLCCLTVCAALSAPVPAAEPPALVTGVVLTREGQSVPGVEVTLVGTDLRAVSGTYGAFTLRGRVAAAAGVLRLRFPDGQVRERPIDLQRTPAVVEWVVDVPLFVERLTVQDGVADEWQETPPSDSVDLEFLDIVRTPGTRADPTFAAQMLPGVVKADQGSGLFVRGGEASELVTTFNAAPIAHPYRYETPTGGFFGMFSALQIAGLSLSSAVFPARFGGAMSGLLELEPVAPATSAGGALYVGLQGGSLVVERPITGGGARFAGSWSDASALADLSSRGALFDRAPRSADLSLDYGRSVEQGELRVIVLGQRSRVGVELEEANFAGTLTSDQRNAVAILRWDRTAGPFESSLVVSPFETRSGVEAGVLDIDLRDRGLNSRFDLTRPLGRWTLRGGVEWNVNRHRSQGFLPEIGGDFGGDGGTRLWREESDGGRAGGYVQAAYRRDRLTVQVGLRSDRYRQPRASSLEPRLDLELELAPRHRLRLAWGIFRQAPDPQYFTEAAHLALMEGRTWVLGYRYGEGEGPLEVHVEAYRKDYDALPLETVLETFRSTGHGFARGVDLFLRVDHGPWSGWLSYSYLDAERLYTPWRDRGRFAPPTEPFAPDFAVPHTVQLVTHRALPADLEAGLAVRLASGAPFTPVVGSEVTPFGHLPRYGTRSSQRLPDFIRVDCSLSHRFLIAERYGAVAYLGVENVFDRLNVFDYAYNDDYSRRRPARSGLGRSLYIGLSLLWGHDSQEVSP